MDFDVRIIELFLFVAVYCLLMIGIGVLTKKWVGSMSDFFTSGREVGTLTIGLGLAAVIFSGATLPTISGLGISHGLWAGSLYMWGWALGLIIFGRFFGTAARRSGIMTLPEWAEIRYNKNTRTLISIANIVASFGAVFSQVVGLGNNLTAITGIPYWLTALFVVILCTFYMYAGGFWALSVSDMIHMLMVIIGICVCVAFLIGTVGSPVEVMTTVEGADWRVFSFFGKLDFSLRFPSVPSLVFGWLFTQLGCQYYWMRAVSSRSEKTVKRGYVLGAIVATLIGSTLLAGCGIYALKMFGAEALEGKSEVAFGMIIKSLPMGLDGILLLAIVAACMSSFSSTLLGTSSTIVRDIYQQFIKPQANEADLIMPSRVITIGVAVLSYVMALLWKQGAAMALAFVWAFATPTAVVLFLGHVWKRVTDKAANISLAVGLVVTVAAYLSPLKAVIHPMWTAFFSTLIVCVVVTLFTKPRYYGRSDFKPGTPSKSSSLVQNRQMHCVSADAELKAFQDNAHKKAMQELMRPWFGGARYRELIERKHNSGFTVPELIFPHLVKKEGGELS